MIYLKLLKGEKMTNNIEKPKAYFIDIDGTLVKNHRSTKLNLEDQLAIKGALKRETYIILSTGRALKDLMKIWVQIDDGSEYSSYGITSNGSGIYNLRTMELMSESFLDEKTYREVFKFAKDNNFAAKNSKEKRFYCNGGLLGTLLKRFYGSDKVSKDFEEAIYDNESAKKIGIISHYSKKKVALYAKQLQEQVKKIDVAISGPGLYIEANSKGVSKGSALKFLCDEIGIDPKLTVHIGDSMNDASAFKVAGHGVAMGDSMKELKDISDWITYSLKKCGVANTIKSFGTLG